MRISPSAAGSPTAGAVKLTDIHFDPRLPLEQHLRYPEFRRLIGLRDFAAYREVFERGWAETSIMCGDCVRLEELPILGQEPPSTPLVNLLGVNDHAPRRVRLAEEFFSEYERHGRRRFMRRPAFMTAYVRDLLETEGPRTDHLKGFRRVLARWRQGRRLRGRIHAFLNVYENMKRFGTLVGRSHVLHSTPLPLRPRDLPWAIDYCGYVKLRDGAHRRAAAHYLGWETIPTLVFEFDRVQASDLEDAHPYLRDSFQWFADIIRLAAEAQPSEGDLR